VLGRPVAFADDCIGEAARRRWKGWPMATCWCWKTPAFIPAKKRTTRRSPPISPRWRMCSSTTRSVAAHRAHASTEGVAHLLPAYAGRLMQAELEALDAALGNPQRPVAAIVGGAKVSTKLELLGNLVTKVNVLIIGGAMANTFLAAQGKAVGKSLQEAEMHEMARSILAQAVNARCEVVLPVDAVVAAEFRANPPTRTVSVDAVPADSMILDVGPASVAALIARLPSLKTLVWNGPLGAFETPPFERATMALAKAVAAATEHGALRSVAGGGDTVSALRQAGVIDKLSYVSSAGGAFLEWLEGKALPGVAALG
jgi:phosphoglycerate kinase